jgi:flagellar protein FliT
MNTNQDQILAVYEKISLVTAAMARAADRADWDKLIELESQCRALFESLPALDDTVSGDSEYQYRKAAIIHDILDNDARIRNQVEPRYGQLQFLLDNTTRARRVESRYGASDCVS